MSFLSGWWLVSFELLSSLSFDMEVHIIQHQGNLMHKATFASISFCINTAWCAKFWFFVQSHRLVSLDWCVSSDEL